MVFESPPPLLNNKQTPNRTMAESQISLCFLESGVPCGVEERPAPTVSHLVDCPSSYKHWAPRPVAFVHPQRAECTIELP